MSKLKLYEIPRNVWIRVDGIEEDIFFHHIDGSYSLCTIKDSVIHLSASTEVELIDKDILRNPCQNYGRCNCLVDCQTGYRK